MIERRRRRARARDRGRSRAGTRRLGARARLAASLGVLAVASGCGSAPDQREVEAAVLQELGARLDANSEKLAAISERLERMETLLARQAARDGRRLDVAAPLDTGRTVTPHLIPVGDAPVRGAPSAPVTLVAFTDFQSSFCAQAAPLIQALLERYPDDLRVAFKHFPMSGHGAARPAAIASEAAYAQGRFWEMHDVLIAHHDMLDGSDAALGGYAREAGLDVSRFEDDVAESGAVYAARIDADIAQGRGLDVNGTPTLFINGMRVENRSVTGMSDMIDAALARLHAGRGPADTAARPRQSPVAGPPGPTGAEATPTGEESESETP